MENKTIIEVNGVKLEVDLSTATVVENYRVGDVVKVLKKQYGDSWSSYTGTIIGFDAFKERPTIIIAYLENSYSASDIKFVYFNTDTKDVEICMANKNDLGVSKATVVEHMNRDIAKKKAEIEDIESKRNFFIENFKRCFENS